MSKRILKSVAAQIGFGLEGCAHSRRESCMCALHALHISRKTRPSNRWFHVGAIDEMSKRVGSLRADICALHSCCSPWSSALCASVSLCRTRSSAACAKCANTQVPKHPADNRTESICLKQMVGAQSWHASLNTRTLERTQTSIPSVTK